MTKISPYVSSWLSEIFPSRLSGGESDWPGIGKRGESLLGPRPDSLLNGVINGKTESSGKTYVLPLSAGFFPIAGFSSVDLMRISLLLHYLQSPLPDFASSGFTVSAADYMSGMNDHGESKMIEMGGMNRHNHEISDAKIPRSLDSMRHVDHPAVTPEEEAAPEQTLGQLSSMACCSGSEFGIGPTVWAKVRDIVNPGQGMLIDKDVTISQRGDGTLVAVSQSTKKKAEIDADNNVREVS